MNRINLLKNLRPYAPIKKGDKFGELEVVREYQRCEGRGVEWLLLCTACGTHTVRPASALLQAYRNGEVCCCLGCHRERMRGQAIERCSNRIDMLRAAYERSGVLYSYWHDECECDTLRLLFEEEFGPIYDDLERHLNEGHEWFELKSSLPAAASRAVSDVQVKPLSHGDLLEQAERWKKVYVTAQRYKHWPRDVAHIKRYAGRARIIEALIDLGWATCWRTAVGLSTDEMADVLVKLLNYYVLRQKKAQRRSVRLSSPPSPTVEDDHS